MREFLQPYVLATALALASVVSSPAIAVEGEEGFCSKRNTNMLVHDEAFRTSLRGLVGGHREAFFYKDGKVIDQLVAGLGGPPNRLERIDEKLVLASACRHHSCPEKAAVVLECPSKIVAAGILHYNYGRGSLGENGSATLFAQDPDEATDAIDALEAWAKGHDAQRIEIRKFGQSRQSD